VRDVMPQLEPRLYQMHSLRAFWTMVLPWPRMAFWMYVASALIILWIALSFWKGSAALSVRFSVLLLATVLVSPHLTVYDLVILSPAFLLLADWMRDERFYARRLGPLLYACYILPLLGPLARWTHVQVSIGAMVLLLWMIVRLETDSDKLAT
jgi:hypothetical protein